jgi:hypothetical protein
MKNDTRKWCDFHKIPWHNTDECRSKQSLVVEVKDKEPNLIQNLIQKIMKKDRSSTQTPLLLSRPQQFNQKNLVDPEEGERLFHSQMWVKGTLLHFIVDSGSQKNLISSEVIKNWGCRQHHTHIHTTLGGFTRDEISVSANSVTYPMASNPSRMR